MADENRRELIFTERLVRIISPIVRLLYPNDKEYRIYHNPPIDIGRIRKEIEESNFKTSEEKSAFRQGWMAAVTTISKDEFPYIDLLNN